MNNSLAAQTHHQNQYPTNKDRDRDRRRGHRNRRGKSKSEYEYDLLVETKNEYTNQLCGLLLRPIYEGFKSIWDSTKEAYNEDLKEGRKPKYTLLEAFQMSLERIGHWSDEIVMREYERIKEMTKWTDPEDFDNLITAVILSRTKILSHIHSGRKMPTIELTIPKPKNFIHKVYIIAGIELWKTPYYYEDRPEKIKSHYKPELLKKTMELIQYSINQTIEKFLPVREILKQSFKEQQDAGSESGGYTSGDSNYSYSSYHDDNGNNGNNEATATPPVTNPPLMQQPLNNGGGSGDMLSERTEMFSDYNRYSSDEEKEGPKTSLQDIINSSRMTSGYYNSEGEKGSGSDDNNEMQRRNKGSDDDEEEETRSVHLVKKAETRSNGGGSDKGNISFSEDLVMPPTPSEYHPLEHRPVSPSPVLKNREPTPIDANPLFIEDDDSDDGL